MYVVVGDTATWSISWCRELFAEKGVRLRSIQRKNPGETVDIYGILSHKLAGKYYYASYQPARFRGISITEDYLLDGYMKKLISLVHGIISLCHKNSNGETALSDLMTMPINNRLASIHEENPDGVGGTFHGTLHNIPIASLTRNYLASFLLQLVRIWGELHIYKKQGMDLTPLFFSCVSGYDVDYKLSNAGNTLLRNITYQYMLPLALCGYTGPSFWATLHLLINYAGREKSLPKDACSNGPDTYFTYYAKRIATSTREYYEKLKLNGVLVEQRFALRGPS